MAQQGRCALSFAKEFRTLYDAVSLASLVSAKRMSYDLYADVKEE